ncbi:MAG: hypothetical protein N2554_07815 [Fimbriimonadales bacterium]|nr:hypothetical protein [Fimbriimonadales bacterium]
MKQAKPMTGQQIGTPLERRLAERIRHMPLGQCLTFEEFMELAQQGRRAKGYHQQMLHLVSCPACRRAYMELRALLQMRRFSLARWFKRLSIPHLPQWALASGVAASVFALALWTFYPRSTNPTLVASRSDTTQRTELAHHSEPTRSVPQRTISGKPSGTTATGREPQRPATAPSQKPGANPSPGGNRKGKTADAPQEQPKPSQVPTGHGSGETQLAQHTPHTRPQPPETGQKVNDTGGEQQIATAGNAGNNRTPTSHPEPPRENLSPIERELAQVGDRLKTPHNLIRGVLGSLASATRSAPARPSFGQLRLEKPRLNESHADDSEGQPMFLFEDRTPAFKWEPVANATLYRVTLRVPRTGEQVDVQELPPDRTEYLVAQSLDPSKTYELTIEAARGRAGTLRGTLRFKVMSDEQRDSLQYARREMDKTPLVSGIIFYALQQYKPALEAFERAQRLYPEDETVRRAVERLRALVER